MGIFSSQQSSLEEEGERKGVGEIGPVREEGRVSRRKGAPPADEHPAIKPLSLPILEPG